MNRNDTFAHFELYDSRANRIVIQNLTQNITISFYIGSNYVRTLLNGTGNFSCGNRDLM